MQLSCDHNVLSFKETWEEKTELTISLNVDKSFKEDRKFVFVLPQLKVDHILGNFAAKCFRMSWKSSDKWLVNSKSEDLNSFELELKQKEFISISHLKVT